MVKLKSFKKRLHSIKCILQSSLMANRSPENAKSNVDKPDENQESINAVCSSEGFIPLAARDSQWVGLAFYNQNFRSTLDEDEFDDEFELQSVATENADPIFLLFPGFGKNHPTFNGSMSSTSDLTKMLVGHKADFKQMKHSKKLMPLAENKLTSVRELPHDEKVSSSTEISTCETRKKSPDQYITDTVEQYDDEEDDEESKRPKHTKRRKKKSDTKQPFILSDEASSRSMLHPFAAHKPSKNKNQLKSQSSVHSSFADDEDNSNEKTNKQNKL